MLAVYSRLRSSVPSHYRQFYSALSTEHAGSSETRQAMVARMLRVDHAGELGADRIYAGQMCVLQKSSVGDLIKHMWEQEKEHLHTFEQLLSKHHVTPTVLLPVWSVAGFVLGAGSALLGKEAAMACTVAVEEVITEHYNDQLRELMGDEGTNQELLQVITKFRNDEMEHHDAGLQNDAEKAPLYLGFKQFIQFGCRSAIWISERI